MNGRKLIKNSAQCKQCGDILISEYTHDYKICSCGNISVDGGLSYCRRSASPVTDLIELSEWSINTDIDTEDN